MSEDFNPEALAEILDIDVETYIEVIDCYLEDTPEILADIKTSITDGDANTLRERAHKIKGSSSTMGLNKVAALALEAENKGKEGSTEGIDVAAFEQAVQDAYGWLNELKQKAAS